MTKYSDNQHIIDNFKSGDVIQCKEGDKITTMIVGDVNIQGGVCDDCSIRRNYSEIEIIGKSYSIKDLESLCDEFHTDLVHDQGSYNFIEWLRKKEKK